MDFVGEMSITDNKSYIKGGRSPNGNDDKGVERLFRDLGEVVSYIDETIIGKGFEMTLRKECPKSIVRTCVKDRKTSMGFKSGVDNKARVDKYTSFS